MTEPIRTCEDHGPFEGEGDQSSCPVCGARGRQLLAANQRRRLSKFMSGALRHFPDDVGLDVDDRGWTAYDALVAAVDQQYDWATADHVAAVIATDPNGRFERTAGTDASDADPGHDRVRAAYGHSINVDLAPTDSPVPDELYHGTAPGNLDSIRTEGLRPMSRQQVHLSGSHEEALRVGRRYTADPIVLIVDTAGMLADGHRITKRGVDTYTTDRVPPAYLSSLPSSDSDSA